MKSICAAAVLILTLMTAFPSSAADGGTENLFPPPPPVPEEENGAAFLEKLADTCPESELRGYELWKRSEADLSLEVDREELEEFMGLHGDLVALIRKAMVRPELQLPADHNPRCLKHLSTGCKAIAAEAIVRAGKGDWAESWQGLMDLKRFGERLACSHVPDSMAMIGLGIQLYALEAAACVIHAGCDPKSLRDAVNRMPASDFQTAAWQSLLRHQYRQYAEQFKVFREGGNPIKEMLIKLHLVLGVVDGMMTAGEIGARSRKGREAIEQSAERLMSLEKRVAELMDDPPADVLEKMSKASAADWNAATLNLNEWHRAMMGADCSTWSRFQMSCPKPDAFLNGFPLQWVTGSSGLAEFMQVRAIMTVAKARMLQLYLALKAWHLDHKELPERLDQLVPGYLPAVPLDPFDGLPVRYDRKASLLRCVGADLKEDSGDGAKRDEDGSKRNDDVILRLRLP